MSTIINLQVGDIIEFESPTDLQLHEKQFIIHYIDNTKIVLIDGTGSRNIINITNGGNLQNESIISISLLSRAETPSYAKQNNLIPFNWVDIYFEGDVPTVITGQITSLDEDQIEVKLITGDTIYIDFAYKGIPDDLPIGKIILREKPRGQEEEKTLTDAADTGAIADTVPDTDLEYETEQDVLPETQFKERVKDILLDADQIQFGDKLGVVAMMVEVPEKERRYGIERQTNDLLNELLSSIPNAQRTQEVLNNIHRMIERFKQLRTMFSKFDANGNAFMPDIQGSDYKPLVKSLETLSQKLYWILPVVTNTKKLYDMDEDVEGLYEDVIGETLAASRTNETEVIQSFRQGTIPNGQNGYDYLTKRMNEAWTPYINSSNAERNIANIKVSANIASIIDNLGDFYSSVAEQENIKRERFVLQQYNLGSNTIETYRVKGGDNMLKIKAVTAPDDISVKSFITLQEPMVSFSRINLPSTNILVRTNLAMVFLSYWRVLNSNTKVHIKPITDDPPVFDGTYLNRIQEYLPSEDRQYNYTDYLNKIIPKTRVLFDIVNKHMKGRLSIPAVLDYLEPFMIYHKDLSFKQYETMTSFIKDKIQLWKRTYLTKKKEFDLLLRKGFKKKTIPQLISLLKGNRQTEMSFAEGYQVNSIPVSTYTDSELLQYLNHIDYGIYLNNALSLMSAQLKLPDSISNLLTDTGLTERYEQGLADTGLTEGYEQEFTSLTQKTCEEKVISKKYITIEELLEDNGRSIQFDKKYDNTYYDVLNEYRQDLNILSDQDKLPYLTGKLQENVGMTQSSAEREAESLLLGYKPVKSGDYALLSNDQDGTFKYYIRKKDTWILDDSMPEDVYTDSNALFCNVNEKCIFINEHCDSLDKAKKDVDKNTIANMVNSLDDTLTADTTNMVNQIRDMTENSYSRLASLILLQNTKFLQYDTTQFEYGQDAKEVMIEKSPYADTLTLILSQSDFVKRQNDISKFVSYYTRPALSQEDPWWLYCNVSNVKILPIFISKLSEAFIKGENYFSYLQTIMSEQGDLGADGEAVIDKYSGWVISYIDFNTEEGYSEDGFVLRSRDVLEADLGNSVAQAPNERLEKFGDSETGVIARVMRAISRYIGLNTDHLETFVLGETAKLLAKSMPSREDYEKAVAASVSKGKKQKETYDIVYNQTLITITLSFLLVGIQTSIPALRTRKTFPGCVKSFTGYPSQGNSDMSGIEYIACVADGIKSSIAPWNSLKKINQKKIISKMEGIINNFILPTEMMQERIRAKNEYNSTVVDEYIPESHDITKWINFLPPLKPITIQHTGAPTEEFQKKFVSDIKKGNKDQFNKINALRSKIIFLSLSIQQAIQKVVTKNISQYDAVLSNNARVPFLENACCNDAAIDTYIYFADKEPSIQMENNIIKDLRFVLEDVNYMSKAPILFDPKDTRILYPSIPIEFDETTIYAAFIAYCKYNTNTPILDELRAICMDKPDNYDSTDSIQDKITKLKQSGRNYDGALLSQLLNVINNKNIVKLDTRNISLNNILKIRDRLEMIQQTNGAVFPKLFIEHFIVLIEQFNSSKNKEDPLPMNREIKNYLSTTCDEMLRNLSDVVRKNTNTKLHTQFLECISNITTFKSSPLEPDAEIYNMVSFLKNNIALMVNVYPNIIINQVKYDNVKIPSCWNLSEMHQNDLKKQTQEHFKLLTQFYNDEDIIRIMERFQYESDVIYKIAEDTLYISPNETDTSTPIFDRSLITLLFRFYILSTLELLVKLSGKDEFYSTITERPSNPMLGASMQEFEVASDPSMMDIVSGDKKIMSEKIAKLITVFMTMTCKDKKTTDITYGELTEKVTRSKEKEKDMIVEFLTEMTDDEREVENMFKNFRIGRWSVGMQKGFRQYEGDTYDKERTDIETRTIMETKLKKTDGVTEGLMDMFALETTIEDAEAEEIEREDNEMPDWAAEDNNITDEAYDEEY